MTTKILIAVVGAAILASACTSTGNVERNAAGGTTRKAKTRGLSSKDAEAVAGIEKKLTSHLGARVAVLHTAKKGRIIIEYQGNEDLQRLLEKLGVET